ncbi:MAG: AAA family ATPase [Byssovorax sp.]
MFWTNQPVAGAIFHDRESELARLGALVDELRAGAPRWLALIGPRKIGKSSLILELSRRTRDLDVLMLDTQEVLPLSMEIFRVYALRAVDALLGPALSASLEIKVATGGDADAVLDAAEAFARLPAKVKTVIRSLARAPMTGDLARVCLDLPEQLAEALGRTLLVAVDEFQELARLGGSKGGDPLPLIRSVWQRHRRVAYIVSGSGRTMLEEMVSRKHSPFFQHFSLMHIGPFAPRDAIALLTTESPPDRPIPEPIAARAVAVLGGHPFYLQLLGEALTSHEPPYDEALLKQAMQEILFSRSGRLALYFEIVHLEVAGRSTFLAATLDALAEEPLRLTDIARATGAPSGDTARYLERLGDVVEKRADGRYALTDPVFGLWLRWRRPGGTAVPMTVIGDNAEREVAETLARSGFELVYQSRASRGSFDLLATRGRHQLGVQVKRSSLPLRFDRPSFQRMSADAKRLGWRWVIAAVSKSDGTLFLDPEKARRGKEVRLDRTAALDNLIEWLER